MVEIDLADLLVSLLALMLIIFTVLSFKLMALQKLYLSNIDLANNITKAKLTQIEFDIKEFRRAYQIQCIKDRKEHAGFPVSGGDSFKIQPLVLTTQENSL